MEFVALILIAMPPGTRVPVAPELRPYLSMVHYHVYGLPATYSSNSDTWDAGTLDAMRLHLREMTALPPLMHAHRLPDHETCLERSACAERAAVYFEGVAWWECWQYMALRDEAAYWKTVSRWWAIAAAAAAGGPPCTRRERLERLRANTDPVAWVHGDWPVWFP